MTDAQGYESINYLKYKDHEEMIIFEDFELTPANRFAALGDTSNMEITGGYDLNYLPEMMFLNLPG